MCHLMIDLRLICQGLWGLDWLADNPQSTRNLCKRPLEKWKCAVDEGKEGMAAFKPKRLELRVRSVDDSTRRARA